MRACANSRFCRLQPAPNSVDGHFVLGPGRKVRPRCTAAGPNLSRRLAIAASRNFSRPPSPPIRSSSSARSSRREFGRSDPQQAIGRPVGLSVEQRARRLEQSRRKLRRLHAGAAARAQTEIGQAQFQRHAAGREALLAQPRGDAIAMDKQDARELGFVADVAVEGRLARDAFCLALRDYGPIVAALRQTP